MNLTVRNGKVNYVVVQKGGVVGNNMLLTTAETMMENGKVKRSTKIEGYPISVTVNGIEYFFEGVWPGEKKNKKVK